MSDFERILQERLNEKRPHTNAELREREIIRDLFMDIYDGIRGTKAQKIFMHRMVAGYHDSTQAARIWLKIRKHLPNVNV